MSTTLPTDSNDRKNYAVFSGCLRYFPAALAGVGKTSKLGNDKHNPGQELHHARGKSTDHGDCIIRHLIDLEDLLAAKDRGEVVTNDQLLAEVSSMAWRALAFSQQLHEKLGAPLAPGAKVPKEEPIVMPGDKKEDPPIADVINLEKRVKFTVGDVVRHIDNDVEVLVEGTYFDVKGKPVLFVKDSDNKIFGVDPNFYKSIYHERK